MNALNLICSLSFRKHNVERITLNSTSSLSNLIKYSGQRGILHNNTQVNIKPAPNAALKIIGGDAEYVHPSSLCSLLAVRWCSVLTGTSKVWESVVSTRNSVTSFDVPLPLVSFLQVLSKNWAFVT